MSPPLFPGAKGCGWISKRKGLDDFIIAHNCSHQDKDSLIAFPVQKYQGNQKGNVSHLIFRVVFCVTVVFGTMRCQKQAARLNGLVAGGRVVKAAIRGGERYGYRGPGVSERRCSASSSLSPTSCVDLFR